MLKVCFWLPRHLIAVHKTPKDQARKWKSKFPAVALKRRKVTEGKVDVLLCPLQMFIYEPFSHIL